MSPGYFLRKIKLTLGIILLASACTRPVNLTQPPLLPPAQTSAAETTNLVTQVLPIQTVEPGTSLQPKGTDLPAAPQPDRKYAVVFLADGEVLNVRAGPGVMNEIVGSLPANAHDLRPTGLREEVEGVVWIEIEQPAGVTGWVSSKFLTEQVAPATMCSDPQVGILLDQWISAIRNQDGRLLAELSSPWHGLRIHHNVMNPAVQFDDPEVISVLFTSTAEYDWGIHEASGEPMVGPFKELVLPKLEDVLLQQHTRNCNTLERGVATGGTNGYVFWPYDYASLNYVALYRPAPPDQELDWRTWTVGIEYVDGKPYLAVLIQFYWEI